MTTKSLTAILRAKDSGFTSTFGKANSLLTKLAGNQSKATRSGATFTGGLKTMVGALGIAKVAGAATTLVTSKLTNALGRIDTMNNFQRTMKLIGQSTEVTEQTMNSLKDATKGTAYGLDVATKAAQDFITRGLAPEKATESVSIWMDAVSSYGKGTNEELSSVMDALAKMRTKGSVEMDQLNRLFDVGIDAVGMYAKAMGRSSEDVQKDLSDKKISAAEFLDVVETAMREGTNGVVKLAGAAKDAGATWAGTIDNMKAAVTRGVVAMVEKFDQLSTRITGKDLKTHIASLGVFFENNLGKIADLFDRAYTRVEPFLNILREGFNQVKGPVTGAINAIKQDLITLYSQFDRTGAINGFSSVIQVAANKINQFAGFIERNSDTIARLIGQLPKLVAGFLAFNQIKSVIQVVAGFGAGVTGALDKVFTATMGLDSKFITNIVTPLLGAINTGAGNVRTTMEGFNRAFQDSFNQSMTAINPSRFKAIFRGIGDAVSQTFPKFSQLTSKVASLGTAVMHPIASLNNLGASLAATSVLAGGSGTVIHGAALKIGAGFKSMAAAGISGIKSLSAAMLSNPITAALMALTAVVVGVVAAWRSNFQNIQGVLKSFGSGVVSSITSLKEQFTFAKPVVDALANVFKGSFKVGVMAAITAVALLVDAFRTVVTAGLTVVKTAMAVGNGIQGLWAKIKGDDKGADKAFKNMKKNLDDIGKGFDNLKNNSATAAAANSMKEFGKETDKASSASKKLQEQQLATSDSISQANSEMITKMSETTNKIQEAGQAMQSAFNIEGSTEGIQKFTQASVEILDRFGQERTEVTDKYNQLMEQAQSASDNKKISLTRQALETVLAANVQGGEDLQSLYRTNSEMLVNNKTQEGQELTEEQRSALQQQNQAIRDGLLEQQQLLVEAAQQKMELGQELSTTELEALKASLTSMNNVHKEQLQRNNEEIAALEQANMAEQNEAVRSNNEKKINDLHEHNAQVNASMAENAALQLQKMSEQDQLKVEQMSATLQAMGITTDEGLQQVFQHYVQSGASIEQQMTLMALMLQNKGVEGSQNLINALQSGDKTAVGKAMSDQVVAGISGLPNEMFVNGDAGKQKFIQALQSGDIQGAGKYLSDQASAGANSGTPQFNAAGTDNADGYKKNVLNKKGETKKAGSDISTAAADGEKQQSPKHNAAGKANGENYVKGLRSQKSAAQNAGRELANASVNGLKSQLSAMRSAGNQGGSNFAFGISSQAGAAAAAGIALANAAKGGAGSVSMTSVGSAMAAGVAAGINAGAGAAISAMASLVNQVNAEANKVAKVNSPSKLTRDGVGKGLSEGVAVGIRKNAGLAITQARHLVQDVYSEMQNLTNPRNSNLNLALEGEINYGGDQMLDRLDRMISLLEQKTNILLDTGELVGATTTAYDQSLGRRTSDAGRWR